MSDKPNEDGRYKLSRPIMFDGETVEELQLSFADLSGEDLILCSKQAAQMDPEDHLTSPVRAFSLPYQIAIAAKAAGVTPELIRTLKGHDFTIVTQKAANFLLGQG